MRWLRRVLRFLDSIGEYEAWRFPQQIYMRGPHAQPFFPDCPQGKIWKG